MESWRDHTASARRTHIFGSIRSLSDDARAIGEPSLRKAVAWGCVFIVAGVLALVGFGGL